MQWQEKVALVTGASSGIGLSLGRALVKRGVKVALVARSAAALDANVRELGATHAAAFPLDVTDTEAALSLPARVHAHFGRLDLLVNNAGRNHRGPFSERSSDELVGILATNLMAPLLLTRAALPLLSEDGVIVNVASLAGKVPVPEEAAYSASKSGLRAFARALDTELYLAGKRQRVVSVCPGPVDTGFLGRELADVPNLVFSQPMSRAEDVARAVIQTIERGNQETDVPYLSGKLATLSYLSPRLFRMIRPAFERLGARKKAAFIAQRST